MKTFRALFNDDMARAIVSGRKTVTRRPMKVQPAGVEWWLHGAPSSPGIGFPSFRDASGGGWLMCGPFLPPASPGDILIGRECWGWASWYDGANREGVEYRADGARVAMERGDDPSIRAGWRPSIHMPDWAARIRRRVVSVTVERVQDVTIQDAVREGFPTDRHGGTDARSDFLCAWDDIYLNRGLASAVNPWVWRIEFERENVQKGGVK